LESGKFKYKFSLFSGENSITIMATSKTGKENIIERLVIYQKED